MDFAAALAALEKTASAAAGDTRSSGGVRDDRRRQRPNNQDETRAYDVRPAQRGRHNDYRPPSDPLDELVRRGFRIRPPPRIADPDTHMRPKHICLLLLCIDSVPYADIWRAWALGNNHPTTEALMSLVIHAKFTHAISTDDTLRKHLLVHPPRQGRGNSLADPEYLSLKPRWGSIQLTQAMLELLRQGMQIGLESKETDERYMPQRFIMSSREQLPETIPPVDHFVFISESCLPVRTLKECTDMIWPVGGNVADRKDGGTDTSSRAASLTDDEMHGANGPVAASTSGPVQQSWVNARNLHTKGVPSNKYERDQFQDIHQSIPESCRWKADQWMLLSRPHAAAVLQADAHLRPADQLYTLFSKLSASDEMYFPTVLAVLGILKDGDDTNSQVEKRQVTYVDWSEGARNPACFEKGARDLRKVAKLAREKGCLFARKFVLRHPGREDVTGQIDAADWMLVMEELLAN